MMTTNQTVTLDEVIRSAFGEVKIPEAELYLHPRFSSSEQNHRTLLREAIYENLSHAFTRESRSKVLLLDLIPTPENGYLSLVHCQGWGGYIYASRPIGIDIEVAQRVVRGIIERVSNEEELKNAPDPRLLWVGKEACFKSLRGFNQPQTATTLRMETWRRPQQPSGNSYYHKFNVRRSDENLVQGRGVAGLSGAFLWSVFTHDEDKIAGF